MKQMKHAMGILLLLSIIAQAALAQPPRLALLIGNADYDRYGSLNNPVNDATDMQTALQELGFEVMLKTNVNQRGMEAAIRDFGNRLRTRQSVGVFYYAGHGAQYENQNYLVPVDADIQSEVDIKYQSVAADYVVEQMQKANTGTNIIILDACRNNPFQQFSRGGGARGLASMAPKGIFVAFATSPGETAADGSGRNGTFTKHLLDALRAEPSVSIADLFIDVTANVDAETGGKQVPWQHVSMTRRFCFADCGQIQTSGHAPVSTVTPTPAPDKTPKVGEVWNDPISGMKFVWISTGCFQMGQTETEKAQLLQEVSKEDYEKYYARELPRHKVCVDGFWMGQYEVTNAQYRLFKPNHDSGMYKEQALNGETQPVVNVSWEDAKAFVEWLTTQHDGTSTFRLPTEAEWEYAARANTTTSRYWGDDPKHSDACRFANVHDETSKRINKFSWTAHACDDGYAVTAPVGSFQSNAFGLYDMLGNVWEWCADWYGEKYYADSPEKHPQVPDSGEYRLLRGGSWLDVPTVMRSAYRNVDRPDGRSDDFGFRVVGGGVRTP